MLSDFKANKFLKAIIMKTTYSKILTLLKKHESEIVFNVGVLQRQADNHLFGIKLHDVYGLDIDPKKIDSTNWIRFDDYACIGIFGEKHGRTISWPDTKGQPKNEHLLMYSFLTGAYMFGEDYPIDLFNKFWDELKTYSPKYIDSMNHSIYFSLDNAKTIFNDFKGILKKYDEINSEDIKLRKIEKLKQDLAKLQQSI